MAAKAVRAVIVGATSAPGKELVEVLTGSVSTLWDLTLVDAVDAAQMTAAGDEAAVVVPLESVSFAAADIVFFAGDGLRARERAAEALAAGANVVDMTGSLEKLEGFRLVTPRMGVCEADLSVLGLVPVQPLVWILAALEQRLPAMSRLVVTALEPASEAGNAGLDELHKQTVGLLSFQGLEKSFFDAQVAFTLRDEFGPEARVSLAAKETMLKEQAAQVLDGRVPFSLQLLSAPVFHSYGLSVWVEFSDATTAETVEAALSGNGFRVTTADEEVSNLATTGLDEVLVRVRNAEGTLPGMWLWMAADNVRLAALNAVACAEDLLLMRPGATLQ
jgi:aspartate-semialdehyde dehydrogenase